jgi:hypothetical protein
MRLATGRQGGSTYCQMQKLPAWKFHLPPPETARQFAGANTQRCRFNFPNFRLPLAQTPPLNWRLRHVPMLEEEITPLYRA